MKTCIKCNIDKPKSDYYKDKRGKHGLVAQCKLCVLKYKRIYNQTPSGKITAKKARIKYIKTPKVKERMKKYWTTPIGKEVKRNSDLKCRYGLTKDAYNRLLEKQSGGCAICGNPHKLHVDHDHKIGKIRGILCNNCNAALGFYQDSIELHFKAIEYLRKVIIENGGTLEKDNGG
jgi:hypothetical protein